MSVALAGLFFPRRLPRAITAPLLRFLSGFIVSYYFTKALSGQQLLQLVLEVMHSVEGAGLKVLRLVQ